MKKLSLLSLLAFAQLYFTPLQLTAKEFTGCNLNNNSTQHIAGRRGRGNDPVGAYTWRIEVDSIAMSEIITGDGSIINFDVYSEDDANIEMTLELCRPELTLDSKKQDLLREALAAGKVSVELIDNQTGEIAFRGDYKGRIRRIRLRERDSSADYRTRNGDDGRITENVSLTFRKIK
ncbi:MAG: hypothetical protein V2I33_12195 [Kangiellaceae bacterium]|jgi:hypothetical protein|nr:hypothetical protein [Kangiellaceae bacterium]